MFLLFLLLSVVVGLGNWEIQDRANQSQSLKILIALKQRNLDLLEKKFWTVSDPYSPDYGNYFTSEQLTELIAPYDSDINTVVDWLKEYGAERIDMVRNKDVIAVTFSVSNLERLFNVSLYHYSHPNGKIIVRSPEPVKIPDHIKQLIDLIHGINDFPIVVPKSSKKNTQKSKLFKQPTTEKLSPGVPYINLVYPIDDGVVVYWNPVCLSGKISNDSSCNGTYKSITISAKYKELKSYQQMYLPTNLTCEPFEDSFNCITRLIVPFYEFLTGLTVSVTFTNNMTFSSPFLFPAVSTPGITPQALWNQYGIPNDYYVTTPFYSQAVVEFEEEYYSPADLQLFFEEMGIYGSDTPVTVVGTNDPNYPTGEASLDIQWIMAMAPGVPTTFFSLDQFDILAWCYYLGNSTNPPLVNSISYGLAASMVDMYLGQGYLARSDTEFQKLASQGITVVIADGDRGAGDLGPAPYYMPNCSRLAPDYPSHSPYISAVGSTYLTPLSKSICYRPEQLGGIDCTVGQPLGEVAVSLDNGLYWTTGGGFSDILPQPPYQVDFVKRYINSTTLPPFKKFNVAGRAYPDYATVGHNVITVIDGQVYPSDGTSASAPIFAGIVALLNEYLAQEILPPLGFVNQLFYDIARRNPAAFNDVTIGLNRCGVYLFPDGTYPNCCDQAYIAEIGWDAVTGLGSPNFNIIKDEVLKLARNRKK